MKELTNEEIYEKVMGHKPNKEFGERGSFSWDDIDALMTEAIKQYSENQVEREATIWKGIVEKLQQENSKLEENEAYLVEHGYKEGQKDSESQQNKTADAWFNKWEKSEQENAKLKESIEQLENVITDFEHRAAAKKH